MVAYIEADDFANVSEMRMWVDPLNGDPPQPVADRSTSSLSAGWWEDGSEPTTIRPQLKSRSPVCVKGDH